MTLFSSPKYWHIFDVVVCNSSVDTGSDSGMEKNQGKNEIRWMEVLSLEWHRCSLDVYFHPSWMKATSLSLWHYNWLCCNFSFNLKNDVGNMIADSRGYIWRKNLIHYLSLQKGLQVVCETLQPDSISPEATISGCHRGNSFDGSLSSQTSQERGPLHSRYMIAMLRAKMYPPSPKLRVHF